jgi:hypothetical protein
LISVFTEKAVWIFKNLAEVKCSIQGTGSYMGCDCILWLCLRTSGKVETSAS